MSAESPDSEPPETAAAEQRPPMYDSATLFQGGKEVWIEHENEMYRLRITRNGKLLLSK